MKDAPAQSVVADSKVSKIIKSLAELEDDLDSLNIKVADMKKSLSTRAQKEIDSLREKVTQMAMQEAEAMISETRARAESQAKKIAADGAAKLDKTRATIDSKFNEAVDSVVSTILKP
jgi:V/A-type H+/Na+-transporting ATPase subunit G/H